MKILCGTDIIEISRIKKAIEDDRGKFINKVFTNAEIDYCQKKMSVRYQHYAVRFAAKEAVTKALGVGIAGGIRLTDVEVISDFNGKPTVKLYGKAKEIAEKIGIQSVALSLSHCKEYAVANAVCLIESK